MRLVSEVDQFITRLPYSREERRQFIEELLRDLQDSRHNPYGTGGGRVLAPNWIARRTHALVYNGIIAVERFEGIAKLGKRLYQNIGPE